MMQEHEQKHLRNHDSISLENKPTYMSTLLPKFYATFRINNISKKSLKRFTMFFHGNRVRVGMGLDHHGFFRLILL